MSKITEYLKQILSARYGRDVRQAIHDGIQQCYYDGKAGGVDLEARQDIEGLEENLANVESIAKGKNRARVFSTTEDMNAWLSDANNKGVAMKGDNLYIVELDVPDWWIAEVLEEPNASGMYYEIAQLETQKVDLTTIENAIRQNVDDIDALQEELEATNSNLSKTVKDSFVCSGTMKESLLALDYTHKVVSGELNSSLISDVPNYPNDEWFYFSATRISETSWDIELTKFGCDEAQKGHLYYGNDINWERIALNSDFKTITATSNTSGIVIVGTNETPLSVICDTGGYYVGRLFKTTDGFWFATIFDVSTAQPVTSEIEVTLVATMKP